MSNAGSHATRHGHRHAVSNGPVTVYPFPIPSTTKNVQRRVAPALRQPEGLDLRGEPERGPQRLAEPAATRRQEPPAAPAHPTHSASTFRRACAFARCYATLSAGQLRALANTAGLEIPDALWPKVLAAVGHPTSRIEPPVSHWRERCAHTPRCATPTACALASARGTR